MTEEITRRAWLNGAMAMGVALPFLDHGVAWAQSSDDAILRHVDPELRPTAGQMLQMSAKAPPLSKVTLAERRDGMSAYSQPPLPDVPYEQRLIPGAIGQPDVIVHIINARSNGQRPAILHMHGGGFVMGDARSSIHNLQEICRTLNCMAVTVKYRLAPETTYAGSIEDGYAALKWLHSNAAQIGADPARIAVMGESAGGGHAALLAIIARDRGDVRIAFQCLVYPMLDDRTGTSRKVPSHVGRLIWTAEANRFGWESFLGVAPGGRTAPKNAVPARVADLSNLPPTFIGVGSIDLFCDEDIDYAQRLNAAGVPAELIVVPGAFHGFDIIPPAGTLARRFNAAKLDALRRGLGLA